MTDKVDISEWIKEYKERKPLEEFPTLEELDERSRLLKEAGQQEDPQWEEKLRAKLAYLNQELNEAYNRIINKK